MKNFIVYNRNKKILRTGNCPDSMFLLQAKKGEFMLVGVAHDATQKVEFDGFDEEGQPINPRVVDKTPEEIEADNPIPPEISFEKQTVHITNKQLQDILKRLDDLEK